MPIIKIGDYEVAVASRHCGPALPCYQLDFNTKSFATEWGSTPYYDNPPPGCWTQRHVGCPVVGICLDCHTVYSPAHRLEGKCSWCGGRNLRPYPKEKP